MPIPCKAVIISFVTAKNCRSIPTSRSTIATIGRNSAWVRKNSFFAGALPTEMATLPDALAPLTPGRSRRIARNSCSSASNCSWSACGTLAGLAAASTGLVSSISGSLSDSVTICGLAMTGLLYVQRHCVRRRRCRFLFQSFDLAVLPARSWRGLPARWSLLCHLCQRRLDAHARGQNFDDQVGPAALHDSDRSIDLFRICTHLGRQSEDPLLMAHVQLLPRLLERHAAKKFRSVDFGEGWGFAAELTSGNARAALRKSSNEPAMAPAPSTATKAPSTLSLMPSAMRPSATATGQLMSTDLRPRRLGVGAAS